MAYEIGDRIGDYQIVDVLGAGGMGKVYKVRNVISERVEAMKVLLPNLESDPDLADRFMREIKVQASLQHPNIAALHTALRVNNQLIMLIEFVEGRTLEAELRNGPLPAAKAVDAITQVLSALSYAHAHGVVHRDIKPANMMQTPSGAVKLMDFGIARLSADRRLTQTGHTVGSLYYMSPEQIQGALDLDARSDLYSLGVTLYELLTNQRPFQGDSDYSIMSAHLSAKPVPPIQIDPSLPPALSEVILMAIAKEPGQRFQTADAFRKALLSVIPAGSITQVVSAKPAPPPPIPVASAPTPQPPPAPPSSRRGLYMAIGSVVTVAVIAVAALQGPKFFKASEASTTQIASTTVPSQQAPVQPNPVPAQAEVVQPEVVQPTTTQPAVSDAKPAPRTPAPPARQAYLQQTQQPPVQQPSYTQQSPAPQAQNYATSPSQAQPTQQPPEPNTVDTALIEALREHRDTLIMLGTRANSAKASLHTIKQQQARMGTNLRGDILTAEQRMETFLHDAEGALKAGDPDRAKKALAMAERALETVEKFLGR